MDKRKKRYNVLIGILSVILCVCMAAGIAFGMGGSETDPAEANAPGSAGVDAVGGEKESADASFPLIAPMAEELPPPVVLQSVSIREGSGDRAPVTGDTIDDPLDPDKGYQFELQFDVAVVSGDLASFKDLIVVWEQRAEEDVDVTGALILSGTGGYIRLSPALKAESSYALVIDQSLLGPAFDTDRVIAFRTGVSAGPPVSTGFSAVFVYPVTDYRNMPIDGSIIVEFNKPVWRNTAENSANVMLLHKSSGEVIPSAIQLTGTVLTVTPASPLAYGTEYELVLAAAIACNDPRTETLGAEQRLSLITRSYAILDVFAVFNEDRSEMRSLQVTTERLGGGPGSPRIMIQIRRDLGARLDSGGTVVYLGEVKDAIDISKNFGGTEPAGGDIYADVYILDNQNRQVGDTFHVKL